MGLPLLADKEKPHNSCLFSDDHCMVMDNLCCVHRSLNRLSHKEWHTVEVTRVGKDGMMIIDGGEPATGDSQVMEMDLNSQKTTKKHNIQ